MSKTSKRIGSAIFAGVAMTMALPAAMSPVASAAGSMATPTSTPLYWSVCDDFDQDKYDCTELRVPIDHDNAALGTIDIAMMRRPANKPNEKIGSLFLNPGGPGGSGRGMPRSASRIFDAEVLDRFDIIGFDPRGVGESNPVQCFTNGEDASEVTARQMNAPRTREEMADSLSAYREHAQFCKNFAGPLIHHMSTKDVARDLDLMREAVGDEKLNYVGFSYGTLLGATYANLFPEYSRAIVIDGNVDPELRTTNGAQYDKERALGFEIALNAYLDECKKVGVSKCVFAEGDPKKKIEEIRKRFRKGDIRLANGSTITFSSFTGSLSGSLYSPYSFEGLAFDLQKVYKAIKETGPAKREVFIDSLSTLSDPKINSRYDMWPSLDSKYYGDDSYFTVNCSDKPFSHTQENIPAMAAEWEKAAPTFGRSQIFSDTSACPVWPVHPDAYRGPWNVTTENPILVFGNYYDPATQYKFSQRMTQELGFARLVTVDAFGHCILGKSDAADKITADYLIDLKVPAPGLVLAPNEKPFK